MADLDTQIEQAQQRLRDLQAKARKQKRRDDTRRLILYGAACLAHIEALDGDRRKTEALGKLHAKVTRSSDRVFLGLEPLPVRPDIDPATKAEKAAPSE